MSKVTYRRPDQFIGLAKDESPLFELLQAVNSRLPIGVMVTDISVGSMGGNFTGKACDPFVSIFSSVVSEGDRVFATLAATSQKNSTPEVNAFRIQKHRGQYINPSHNIFRFRFSLDSRV